MELKYRFPRNFPFQGTVKEVQGASVNELKPRCFIKYRFWREVKVLDGKVKSIRGCMCSCSRLPEVKEGKLEFCVVCERDITH